MFKCLADNTEHPTQADLHKHIRYSLKLKQEDYYRKYVPRFDLQTGEPVPFKSVEQYLKTDFVHKNNLKKYLKEKPAEGRNWAINFLKKRKEEKGLTYAPTQAELRTLMCPTMPYFESVGGYNKVCEELGYKIRFNSAILPPSKPIKGEIIIDTREQTPLLIKGATVRAKLNCGDYGLNEDEDQNVYIERKSLNDFFGTFTKRVDKNGSNFDRFERELERAAEVRAYLIVLVEVDINTALGAEFNGTPMRGASPEHAFQCMRELLAKHLNFQMLFVGGRQEAKKIVPVILGMGEGVRDVDLQYAYETGKFNL